MGVFSRVVIKPDLLFFLTLLQALVHFKFWSRKEFVAVEMLWQSCLTKFSMCLSRILPSQSASSECDRSITLLAICLVFCLLRYLVTMLCERAREREREQTRARVALCIELPAFPGRMTEVERRCLLVCDWKTFWQMLFLYLDEKCTVRKGRRFLFLSVTRHKPFEDHI